MKQAVKIQTKSGPETADNGAARAVIYLRVSTNKQEQGTSLESQLFACSTKAERLGARVVGVVEDTQSGADYIARSGLQDALGALERDEADILISYDLTRFSRDIAHQQLIKKRVEAAGKRLEFATFDFGEGNTPEADMLFGVNGVFAAYERSKTRHRTMQGTRRRAVNGLQPRTYMRPFGYEIVSKQAVLEGRFTLDQWGTYCIVESEARFVREIFARYAGGASLYEVARYLKSEGVPTLRGGRVWYANTVREILLNPVYKGEAVFGRWKSFSDETRLDKGLGKRFKRLAPESERVIIPAPAIIDSEIWEECQKRLQENRARRGGNPDRVYLLSGLLACPECGHAMGGRKHNSVRGGDAWKAVYVCRHHSYSQSTGRKKCGYSRMFSVLYTDEAILNQILETASRPELIASSYRTAPPTDELTELRRRLGEIEKQQDALIEAQTRAILQNIATERYEVKLSELDKLARELRARQQTLQSAEIPQSAVNARAQALARMVEDLKIVLLAPPDKVSTHQKHALLGSIVERIIPRESGESPNPKDRLKVDFEIIWKGLSFPASQDKNTDKKKA